jgi:peptide/nickel transport system permease protein
MPETVLRPTTTTRLLLRNRLAVVGLVFIAVWTLGALLAGLLPYGATQPGAGGLLSPPTLAHPFGPTTSVATFSPGCWPAAASHCGPG